MQLRHIRSGKHGQRGFSLVELMISIVLGLLILSGVTTAFTNSSRSRQELEKTSQQIENGRYAMQLLGDDLQLAGYYAEFDPTPLTTTGLTALPNACATDLTTLRDALSLHIQGYDNGSGAPTCVDDVKSGTDIVVVRRASTCSVGTADCDAVVSGAPYFQASLCAPATGGTELSASPTSNADYAATYFALDTATGNLTRHKIDCTTVAPMRRYLTHIYFIANNNLSGDGIPTLKRAELGAAYAVAPLVEGIENLQLEYGLDTDNNGVPDVYTANPTSYGACAGTACVSNWRNVVAVKVNVLARNTAATTGHSDSKVYTLGLKADGTDNTVGPFGDSYKRHAYATVVRLGNPAGRRE